jgi:hypothetical protein
MTTLTAHSYHINISTGDAAIHLLVEEVTGPGQRSIIHNAVLIDGGDSGSAPDGPLANVKAVIDMIEKYYAFKDGGTTLRFDSVVITHW